jgi:methylphosphotriester-DNA--protein-cysteine methyltransferase
MTPSLAPGSAWPSGGRAYLRPGHGVYLGGGPTTNLHASHSVKILMALEGSFRVRAGSKPWAQVRSIVIGSEVPHAFESNGAPVAIFWIHPEAFFALGRGRRLSTATAPLPAALEASVRVPLRRHGELGGDPGELDAIAAGLVRGLRSDAVVSRLDPRVARVIDILSHLDSDPSSGPNAGPPDHGALAARVNLSPTRLTHLFRQETGISLRNYQLWNRGRSALARIDPTRSLTALAHDTGFADGAHLSRTSRRMLGVKPTLVHRHCTFIVG